MINQFILQRLTGILDTLNSNYTSTIRSTSAGKGSGRANFIKLFLGETIPSNLRISTSGEITDVKGNLTGELDIVIENGLLPSWPLLGADSTRLFIPESVAAVIEVKSDIAGQWSQMLNTYEKVNKISREFVSGIFNHNSLTVLKLPFKVENENLPKLEVTNKLVDKVPFFVVGYTGWESFDTLSEKMRESGVSGILQLDKGMFVSGNEYNNLHVKQGPLSLYAFIECLNKAANIVNMGKADTLKYVT